MNYNNILIEAGIVDGRGTLPRHLTKEWDLRNPDDLLGVVFHQSLDTYGTASGNAKYHVGPNHISTTGLPSLSYTIFCEKSGKLILANDVEYATYSQGNRNMPGDENADYLSVCFGGNFSGPGYNGTQNPTRNQLESADFIWNILKETFNFKNNQLFGHYDFGKPACPGYELSGVIESINNDFDWEYGYFNLSKIVGRQEALTQLGYYTKEIDGDWGPESKYSLMQFQLTAGLNPDGIWGKKTEIAILNLL